MAAVQIHVRIHYAWWLKYLYLPLLQLTLRFCRRFIDADMQIDEKKLHAVLDRGVTAYFIDGDGRRQKIDKGRRGLFLKSFCGGKRLVFLVALLSAIAIATLFYGLLGFYAEYFI